MANRTVSIFYSVRVNGQHHRLKPVLGKNHKITPEWAVFKGTDTHLPGGSYTLGWYEGSRRVWRDVGINPQDAVAAADRQRVSLAAVRVADDSAVDVLSAWFFTRRSPVGNLS